MPTSTRAERAGTLLVLVTLTCGALASGTLLAEPTAPGEPSPAPAADRSAERYCLDALDRVAGELRRSDTAGSVLLPLARECSELPQLRHNLAVLAARQGDWDTTIAELEAAIALDTRAAHSVEALRAIHRWRAGRAWAEALGTPAAQRAPPVPEVQDSRLTNSDSRRRVARDALLRDEDAIEHDLWQWWTSAAERRVDEHHRHYAADLRGQPLIDTVPSDAQPDWDAVERTIGFTAEDAVVVLRWTGETGEDRADGRLLLLRLDGDRWQIYEERTL